MSVRLLVPQDVPAALELSTAAGWNQTAGDWRRMIELEPEACFGIERDDRLVATTSLLCYGTDLAWVGMVLTHHAYQRLGLARRLVSAALDTARGRGIRTLKLDATDQGQRLYESVGFIAEQPIERWRTVTHAAQCDSAAGFTGPLPHAFDVEAFGADRSRFLRALGSPAVADEQGYAMARPGSRARYLGPCVARDPHTAGRLIAATLTAGTWFWDLLPANSAAPLLAIESGFQPVRQLVRMRLGPPLRTRDDWVFAIGGFEAG